MYRLSLNFTIYKNKSQETSVTKKVSIVLQPDGIKRQNKRKSR
jgi:hypothetical protein